jgi:Zn-dependent membrane protease YugP
VRSTYRRYRAVPNHAGLAGAEIASALLDAHGLQRVCIVWPPLVLGAEELRKAVVRRRTA